MKKHYYYIAVLAILIMLFAATRRHPMVERFEEGMDVKPECTVYYTDNISACDAPRDVNGVRIDFSYHRKYYENMKEQLEKRQTQAGNMTQSEAQQYATILDVLRQYDKMLDGQSCKLTIPNWQQITDNANNVTLGNIEQNTERGNARQWAFCLTKRSLDVEDLDGHGLDIEKRQDGSLYTIDHQGHQYARGAFPNFNLDTMKSLYCTETVAQTSQRFSGVQIDPFAFTIKVITNGEIQNTLDRSIVNKFIDSNLLMEDAIVNGNIESVYMKSKPLIASVYKINHDICGRDNIVLTNSRISIQLADMTNPIKQVAADQANVLGTRADLIARKAELVTQRDAAIIERDKAWPLKNLRDNVLTNIVSEIGSLSREIYRLNVKLGNAQKAQKGLGAGVALMAVPGIGMLAGLASAFASIGLKRQRQKWKKDLKKRQQALAVLQTNCGKVCDLTRFLCNTNQTCPKVKMMMEQYVKQSNEVYQPLADEVVRYDTKIAEIDNWLKKMDDDILQFLIVTIQSGSFTISEPPYEALSWDNKFYITI